MKIFTYNTKGIYSPMSTRFRQVIKKSKILSTQLVNAPLGLSITNWSFGQDRSWQFSHHPQPSHASQHISASNERPNVNSSPYRQNQKSYLSDRYNFGLEELTLIQWHMKNLLLHQFSKLYIMALPVVEFQGRDTKLERFLHKNQLQSNEIIEF